MNARIIRLLLGNPIALALALVLLLLMHPPVTTRLISTYSSRDASVPEIQD